MNIVIVSHVGHGKSTPSSVACWPTPLTSRRETRAGRAKCELNSKPFEYASCSMRSRMSRPRVVRLKLNRVQDSGTIEAHISRSHYDRLGITKGQRVFVSPTNVRALAEPC